MDNIAEPALRAGAVKIKVAFAGICGSDMAIHAGGSPEPLVHPLVGESGPHVLGHEFSGHVVSISEDVTGIEVGELVTVRPTSVCGSCVACESSRPQLCANWAGLGIHGGGGGFSEYVVVNSDQVFVLPATMSAKIAALVEPLSVAWHAVRESGVTPGETAVVVGAGPIGLGIILALKAHGVDRIIATEPSARRRTVAKQFGADAIDPMITPVSDYVREATNGAGAEVSFESSGAGTATFETAVEATGPGGRTVIVALYGTPVSWNPASILFSEKQIVGSFGYWNEDYQKVIEALDNRAIDAEPLITNVISLENLVEHGLTSSPDSSGSGSEIKILVAP